MVRVSTLLAGAAALTLGACTAVQNHRGYVPDAEMVESIAVGQDTRETVSQKLGSPTVAGTFSNDKWYYISSYDVQTAFFRPHATERKILAIEFSPTGQVADIRRYGLEDGRVVNYVGRETPTRGRDLTFLQQLFNAIPGNVGAPSQAAEQNPGGGR